MGTGGQGECAGARAGRRRVAAIIAAAVVDAGEKAIDPLGIARAAERRPPARQAREFDETQAEPIPDDVVVAANADEGTTLAPPEPTAKRPPGFTA